MGKSAKKTAPVLWLVAVVLLVVCCGSKLYGIMPFGTPMFCALAGQFFFGVLAPVYLLCEFLFTFDVWRLYTAGVVIFIIAIRWFCGLKFARCGKRTAKTLFSVGAIVAEAVISALFAPIVDVIVSGFVGVTAYYFSVRVAECVVTGFAARPSVPQAASVAAVCFIAGLGAARAQYVGIIIGLAPALFFVLLTALAGPSAALACGGAMAVGLGLGADITVMPAFFMCVMTAIAFNKLARPVYSLVSVGVFAAVQVLFYVEPIAVGWNALTLAVGGMLFCLLPRRAIKSLRAYFDYDGTARLAVRHYINRTRADAGNKMLAVASVFDETARLMNVLTPSEPDFSALGATLMDKVCPYCNRKNDCDKVAAEQAFTALAQRAYSGRAIIAELPDFFTRECSRTVDAVGASTAVTDGAARLKLERECDGKAKAVVTEKLAAIREVLEELGRSQAEPIGFDGRAEDRIRDELCNNGVECAAAFCTKRGVTAIVRTNTADRASIKRAVSVCLKSEHELVSLEKTQAAGWSVASLKKRPMYEAVYARAGLGKDGVSGDSYTFKRIGDKFLAALADGMGTGVRAGESSSAAVELIECFYRAGFDSQTVIAGVNRFLKLPSSENYSAADVAVCDLDSAVVDIIKIGSPACYIKTTDTVLKISGSSLPIGVLDELRPYVTSKRLYPGQMLVLVTDGVSDCFSGDELPEYINGLSAFNPETTVSAIIKRALALNGGTPKDDMTAVAFRLYEKKIKNSELKVQSM